MSSQQLTCPCGHTWTQRTPEPVPADLRQICPVCTARTEATRTRTTPDTAHSVRSDPSTDVASPTQVWNSAALPPSQEKTRASSGSPVDLAPGAMLGGFEIVQELNRGGMGVIYKARQPGLNRLVALKVIAPDQLGRSDTLKRFQREVQAAALLIHPNIVTVFLTDLEGPLPFLAMEFVPGIDLYHLVLRNGPLPVLDACFYVEQAAQGLQHAFEHGLVHRDIKPANLMVTPSPLEPPRGPGTRHRPRVKILDLGLARVVSDAETEDTSHLTQLGEFLGTPDYMSPEQADDPRLVDIRSDLYSLGATLYFLLTGEVPFPGKSLMQKLKRQLTHPAPSLAEKRPDVPPSLAHIVARLLAREPDDRFQTPFELADALTAVMHEPERQAALPQTASPAVRTAVGTELPPAPAPSTHNTIAKIHAHDGGVRSLSLSTDGSLLLSAGADETLRLWETTKLREQIVIAENVGPVQCARLAPGNKWAASCAAPRLFTQDMVAQLWYLASRSERRRLKGHTRDVRCLAISPDARRVAAGGDDPAVRVWMLEQPGTPPLVLQGHTDTVRCLLFLTDNVTLLSGSQDGTVRVWDVRTGASKGALKAGVGPVHDVAFCGARKSLAIAGANGLRLRQADGSLRTLRGHRGVVHSVSFSPDGRYLASAGADGVVRLWQAEDGEDLAGWEGHTGEVAALVFTSDSRAVFSGGLDGTVRRWPVLL